MSLVVNLPARKVYVRKEYLTDHQSGFGEFVEGVWVSAKSIPGRAFILRLIFLNMGQCMTNSQSVRSWTAQRPLNLI